MGEWWYSKGMSIIVSITGKLESMERKEAAKLIETKTNAVFKRDITYDTNYLIATEFNTSKAKKAAAIGVAIISEKDMLRYIDKGKFPVNSKPTRPVRDYSYLFNWEKNIKFYDLLKPIIIHFTYVDSKKEKSERMLQVNAVGKYDDRFYFAGFCEDEYKTFRSDRMLIHDMFDKKNNKIKFDPEITLEGHDEDGVIEKLVILTTKKI